MMKKIIVSSTKKMTTKTKESNWLLKSAIAKWLRNILISWTPRNTKVVWNNKLNYWIKVRMKSNHFWKETISCSWVSDLFSIHQLVLTTILSVVTTMIQTSCSRPCVAQSETSLRDARRSTSLKEGHKTTRNQNGISSTNQVKLTSNFWKQTTQSTTKLSKEWNVEQA